MKFLEYHHIHWVNQAGRTSALCEKCGKTVGLINVPQDVNLSYLKQLEIAHNVEVVMNNIREAPKP